MAGFQKHCRWGLPLLICWSCNLPPDHQRAVDSREQHFGQTVDMLAKTEAARPQQLEWTLNLLARDHLQQVENFEKLGPRIDAALEQDVEHFENQLPVYRQELIERLKGNPQAIERRLPDLY